MQSSATPCGPQQRLHDHLLWPAMSMLSSTLLGSKLDLTTFNVSAGPLHIRWYTQVWTWTGMGPTPFHFCLLQTTHHSHYYQFARKSSLLFLLCLLIFSFSSSSPPIGTTVCAYVPCVGIPTRTGPYRTNNEPTQIHHQICKIIILLKDYSNDLLSQLFTSLQICLWILPNINIYCVIYIKSWVIVFIVYYTNTLLLIIHNWFNLLCIIIQNINITYQLVDIIYFTCSYFFLIIQKIEREYNNEKSIKKQSSKNITNFKIKDNIL